MTTALRGLEPRAGPRPPDGWAARRLVGVLRLALPATALLLIALVVAWPQIMGRGAGLIAPMFAPSEMTGAEVMLMHRPRYVGETDNAEPFELTAASASLDPLEPSRVHLDQLAAAIDARGQRDFRLLATSGIYDRERERLDLSDGIEVTTSDGYRFQTPSATINLVRARAVGSEPIVGSGPSGTLSADRFEFENGGQILRFKGRVRVTWQPRSEVRS